MCSAGLMPIGEQVIGAKSIVKRPEESRLTVDENDGLGDTFLEVVLVDRDRFVEE